LTEGLALNIGLNSVDSQSYVGWSGTLNAPENDVKELTALANSQGFKVTKLINMEATYNNVIEQIKKAQSLQDGDIFMFSYSGYGGMLPYIGYPDKTLCLYDRQLRYSEILYLISKFNEGVRIISILDSSTGGYRTILEKLAVKYDIEEVQYKFAPAYIFLKLYRINKKEYDEYLRDPRFKNPQEKIKSSVIFISACEDNQIALDGSYNSLFISKLLDVWDNGTFNGSYQNFHRTIVSQMPPYQTPTYLELGKRNTKFVNQKPFTI
jgi:hypothetical protein